MSIGELLDRAFRLYRNYFWLWIAIAAGPQAFYFAVSLMGNGLQTSGHFGAAMAGFAIFALGFLVYWTVTMASQGAIILGVSDLYLNRTPTVGSTYSRVWPRFWPLIAVSLITGVAIVIGTLMCLLPGIAAAIFFAMTPAALLIERADVGRAIERSFALAKEAWMHILLVYLLYFALTIVVAGLTMTIAFVSAADKEHQMLWLALQALLGAVANTLVIPWLQIAITLVYFDQRIRREGFDLHVLIANLDSQMPPSTPPGAAPAV